MTILSNSTLSELKTLAKATNFTHTMEITTSDLQVANLPVLKSTTKDQSIEIPYINTMLFNYNSVEALKVEGYSNDGKLNIVIKPIQTGVNFDSKLKLSCSLGKIENSVLVGTSLKLKKNAKISKKNNKATSKNNSAFQHNYILENRVQDESRKTNLQRNYCSVVKINTNKPDQTQIVLDMGSSVGVWQSNGKTFISIVIGSAIFCSELNLDTLRKNMVFSATIKTGQVAQIDAVETQQAPIVEPRIIDSEVSLVTVKALIAESLKDYVSITEHREALDEKNQYIIELESRVSKLEIQSPAGQAKIAAAKVEAEKKETANNAMIANIKAKSKPVIEEVEQVPAPAVQDVTETISAEDKKANEEMIKRLIAKREDEKLNGGSVQLKAAEKLVSDSFKAEAKPVVKKQVVTVVAPTPTAEEMAQAKEIHAKLLKDRGLTSVHDEKTVEEIDPMSKQENETKEEWLTRNRNHHGITQTINKAPVKDTKQETKTVEKKVSGMPTVSEETRRRIKKANDYANRQAANDSVTNVESKVVGQEFDISTAFDDM